MVGKPSLFTNKLCLVENCFHPVKYKGLCGKHYKRQWRHGDPNVALINFDERKCSVEDCNKRATNKEFCTLHAQRNRRYGRVHNIIAAKGEGRPITTGGYVLLTVNGQRKLEHIYLAEKALGKPLPPKAVVHHMNNDPANNYTPFNLVICPSQAYHLMLHARARELDRRDAIDRRNAILALSARLNRKT